MVKLIIGLGNPGDKYKTTRHNLGFLFLDYMKEKEGFENFAYESKFKAEISNGVLEGEKVILVQPQTFMNLSGESVSQIINFYKISQENIIIIYDDKDMEFGKIRYRKIGSAGGHNGIKSIIKYLGQEWNRIKVGVGSDEKYETSDWVLSKFSEEELIDLENEIFPKVKIQILDNLDLK